MVAGNVEVCHDGEREKSQVVSATSENLQGKGGKKRKEEKEEEREGKRREEEGGGKRREAYKLWQ